MVSKLNRFLNCIIEHRSFVTEVPDFSRSICSVRAEHRKESSHLKPSSIKLAVSFVLHTFIVFALPEPLRLRICVAATATILPFISNCKERTDIQCPVRITTQSHIQAFYDLDLEVVPGSAGIAGPQHGCVFLPGCITGTGQIEDTFVFSVFSLVFINTLCMHQCKRIGNSRIQIFLVLAADKFISLPWLSLHAAIPVRTGERLCGIAPPGFESFIKETFFCLFPVHFTGFFIKSIIGCIVIKQIACVKKFLMVFAARIHIRPYRNHAVCMHFVDFFHAFFVVTVAFLVEDLFTPVAWFPGIPVLNDTIDRNTDLSVMTHDLSQFFCCVILLFGLDVAIRPLRQHLCFTCQITVVMNDLIHCISTEEIIIDLVYRIQEQIGFSAFIIKSHQ